MTISYLSFPKPQAPILLIPHFSREPGILCYWAVEAVGMHWLIPVHQVRLLPLTWMKHPAPGSPRYMWTPSPVTCHPPPPLTVFYSYCLTVPSL